MSDDRMNSPTWRVDDVLAARRQQREQRRIELLRGVKEALGRLADAIAFRNAYIFGSLVKPGRFFEDSDIDIAVEGLKDEDLFPAIAFLSRELGREVDVIQLEGHRLEGKIRQEGLRWNKPH